MLKGTVASMKFMIYGLEVLCVRKVGKTLIAGL